jgi:hypothetical protein
MIKLDGWLSIVIYPSDTRFIERTEVVYTHMYMSQIKIISCKSIEYMCGLYSRTCKFQ